MNRLRRLRSLLACRAGPPAGARGRGHARPQVTGRTGPVGRVAMAFARGSSTTSRRRHGGGRPASGPTRPCPPAAPGAPPRAGRAGERALMTGAATSGGSRRFRPASARWEEPQARIFLAGRLTASPPGSLARVAAAGRAGGKDRR